MPVSILKQWIAETSKTVFSSAFYYFSKGEMSFEQTKIFCSENIVKNIVTLDKQHVVSAALF